MIAMPPRRRGTILPRNGKQLTEEVVFNNWVTNAGFAPNTDAPQNFEAQKSQRIDPSCLQRLHSANIDRQLHQVSDLPFATQRRESISTPGCFQIHHSEHSELESHEKMGVLGGKGTSEHLKRLGSILSYGSADKATVCNVANVTDEQLDKYVASQREKLDQVHLDEVEELDNLFLEEMDNFKDSCSVELSRFNHRDESDHSQIQRLLVVQKMRMQRLKNYQLNAKREVDKRHLKEKKKVDKVIKKRLNQIKNAIESETNQTEERQKAILKFLTFFHRRTFLDMIEGHPMTYQPLFEMNSNPKQPLSSHEKQHGVVMQTGLDREFHIIKTEGQLPIIKLGDGDRVLLICDENGEDEDRTVLNEYMQAKLELEGHQGQGKADELQTRVNGIDGRCGQGQSESIGQSKVIDGRPLQLDICWFSPKVGNPEHSRRTTINLAECQFNIVAHLGEKP